jgi:hypothetical protein
MVIGIILYRVKVIQPEKGAYFGGGILPSPEQDLGKDMTQLQRRLMT